MTVRGTVQKHHHHCRCVLCHPFLTPHLLGFPNHPTESRYSDGSQSGSDSGSEYSTDSDTPAAAAAAPVAAKPAPPAKPAAKPKGPAYFIWKRFFALAACLFIAEYLAVSACCRGFLWPMHVCTFRACLCLPPFCLLDEPHAHDPHPPTRQSAQERVCPAPRATFANRM